MINIIYTTKLTSILTGHSIQLHPSWLAGSPHKHDRLLVMHLLSEHIQAGLVIKMIQHPMSHAGIHFLCMESHCLVLKILFLQIVALLPNFLPKVLPVTGGLTA